MAYYSKGIASQLARFGFIPGLIVYVDTVDGSDVAGTGDGTSEHPYATVTRGILDLRTGENDVLAIRGTVEVGTVIQDLSNLAIVSLDANVAGPVAQGCTVAAGPAVGGGSQVAITVTPVGTVPVANQGVVLFGAVENGLSRINTVGRALNVSGTTFDMMPAAFGVSGDYPPATNPRMFRASMTVYNCENVLLMGFEFNNGGFGDDAAGLVITECRNILVTDNLFTRGWLGLQAFNVTQGQFKGGATITVENNEWALNAVVSGFFGQPDLLGISQINTHNCMDPVFARNIFSNQLVDAIPPVVGVVGYDAPGINSEGFINVASNPRTGMLFTGNQVANKWGTPGQVPGAFTKMFHLDEPVGSEDIAPGTSGVDPRFRTAVKGNFWQDNATGARVDVDPTVGLKDTEPNTIPNQTYLNTWRESVWNPLLSELTVVSGSIGRSVAILSYRGAIHIDTVSGTSGSILGFNGLPQRPVNNLADARALSDEAGILVYAVLNTLTIDTNHEGFEFNGENGPENDTIIVASGVSVDKSTCNTINVQGQTTGFLTLVDCTVGSGSSVTVMDSSLMNNCAVEGTLELAAGAVVSSVNLTSRTTTGTLIDFAGNAGSQFLTAKAHGIWDVGNMNDVSNLLGFTADGSFLSLNSTCTRGIYILQGQGELLDSSVLEAGLFLFVDRLLRGTRVDVDTSSRASAVDLAVVSGSVDRLYGANNRTRLFYAVNPVTGRNVPINGASHMEVSIKAEAATDWSSPSVHYVVFSYQAGADAETPPAVATISGTAPTDGLFTAEPF